MVVAYPVETLQWTLFVRPTIIVALVLVAWFLRQGLFVSQFYCFRSELQNNYLVNYFHSAESNLVNCLRIEQYAKHIVSHGEKHPHGIVIMKVIIGKVWVSLFQGCSILYNF